MTPEELISSSAERWDFYEGLPESTLLRLAILRDLARLLHAEKSRCLAHGLKHESKKLRLWEDRIDLLRGVRQLTGHLDDALQGKLKASKQVRPLPEALFARIEKNKFDRYDRAWEAALAAEAAALAWNFWTLDAWVQIEQAEQWHLALGNLVLPRGILLFAESTEVPTGNPVSTETTDRRLWHGRWLIIMRPDAKGSDFPLHPLPGLAESPQAPTWKLIYSPSSPRGGTS